MGFGDGGNESKVAWKLGNVLPIRVNLRVTPPTHFCPVIARAAKEGLLSLGDHLKNKKVLFS